MRAKVRNCLRKGAIAVLRNVVFPARYRVFTWVESIVGQVPGTSIVKLRGGGKLIVDGIVDAPILYMAEHDWRVRRFLCKTARSGHTVFDLGANIGVYTIPMALRVGKGGHVYAFEAFRPNYEILLQNIALNKLTNVTPVFGVLTDKSGACLIPEIRERSQTGSDLGNYSLAMKSASLVEVPALSLDDFVMQYGIDRVDLMKIDIEGSETKALKGARTLFSQRRVGTVVCEFNPRWLSRMGSSAAELYEIASEYGLDTYLLTRLARIKLITREFCCSATAEFDAVLKPRPILH